MRLGLHEYVSNQMSTSLSGPPCTTCY